MCTLLAIYQFSVAAKVPPLEVILTSGSPYVTESSIEVEFDTTRPVTRVTCFLRYDNKRDYQDCMLLLYNTLAFSMCCNY